MIYVKIYRVGISLLVCWFIYDDYWHAYDIVLQDTDNLWWDSFATDFFEDDATLTLTFGLEDGPKRYSMSTVNLHQNYDHDDIPSVL